MAEQDALITVEEDELITAETTNANNRYLEDKISENATTLTNYLERELTRVENELEGEITSAQTTLQQNINDLSAKVSNINFAPNYNNRQTKSVDTTYTADEPGWVNVYAQSTNAATTYYYINGVSYTLSSNGNNDTDTAGAGAWFLVDVGDRYMLSSSGWQWGHIYFLPLKGEN